MMGNFTTSDIIGVVFIGFGMVFCVLAVIYLVMRMMKVVFHDMPMKRKKGKTATQPVSIAKAEEIDDDEEIAAVLTVIAAAMDTDVGNIKLNSLTQMWQPTFKNDFGGNANEKLYSKDKWKNI